jgi:ATP-binding cassette subfamily F protein 3
MLLSCQNIEFSYISEKILKNVSFHVNEGEQTAIVGVNGAGKTTLFKVLTGELTPDSGDIFLKNGTSIGYLSQTVDYSSHNTVYDELHSADQALLTLDTTIKTYEQQMAHSTPDEKTIHDYHKAIEDFESMDGYSYESRIKGILKGLGFPESSWSQNVSTLSGGQKTRLALGRLLLIQPDLLFLDEPTNHLDLEAIRWLENYLNNYKGTLLIISHDRYFLDRIVHKIVDIELGKASVYQGNYTAFVQKKEFDQYIATKHYEEQQAEIKRQEAIIKQLRSFKQEKFIKRAVSREKALEKIDPLDKPIDLQDNMRLALNPKRESGMDVLQLKDLSLGYDNVPLFSDANLNIYKGERIALIGKNGTGKSSLLKLLLGDLKPIGGSAKIGQSVEIAYYDQEHTTLNESLTLVEEIAEDFPTMEMRKIRNLLASFLFTGDDVFKQVGTLSGGEKGRLSLAKLMLAKGNFLLLDEPTNHLDMISKEVLEKALRHYTGTILFISHDRYFINRVATKVWELDQERIKEYHGSYDYYIEKKEEENASDMVNISENPNASENKQNWERMKQQQKDERKLQNQIDELEAKITSIETRMEAIDEELTHEEIFSNYEKSSALMKEKNSLEVELEEKLNQWESLQ